MILPLFSLKEGQLRFLSFSESIQLRPPHTGNYIYMKSHSERERERGQEANYFRLAAFNRED